MEDDLRIAKSFIMTVLGILFGLSGRVQLAAQDLNLPKALEAYTSCHFSDDLQIVRTDPLATDVTARNVETAEGSRRIDMEAGVRVMFAYPLNGFYANVKVELLPAANYLELKKALQANFDYVLAHSPGSSLNPSLPPLLRDFEIRGEDRTKLEGGVLGIDLLFDDKSHVVTTVYLLNQEPLQRKFQSIEEYKRLRDQFLQTYTGCIRQNQALLR
jgi:hypothetical protein